MGLQERDYMKEIGPARERKAQSELDPKVWGQAQRGGHNGLETLCNLAHRHWPVLVLAYPLIRLLGGQLFVAWHFVHKSARGDSPGVLGSFLLPASAGSRR